RAGPRPPSDRDLEFLSTQKSFSGGFLQAGVLMLLLTPMPLRSRPEVGCFLCRTHGSSHRTQVSFHASWEFRRKRLKRTVSSRLRKPLNTRVASSCSRDSARSL